MHLEHQERGKHEAAEGFAREHAVTSCSTITINWQKAASSMPMCQLGGNVKINETACERAEQIHQVVTGEETHEYDVPGETAQLCVHQGEEGIAYNG